MELPNTFYVFKINPNHLANKVRNPAGVLSIIKLMYTTLFLFEPLTGEEITVPKILLHWRRRLAGNSRSVYQSECHPDPSEEAVCWNTQRKL